EGRVRGGGWGGLGVGLRRACCCGQCPRGECGQRLSARTAMADFLLAAWFLWITPLLAALSNARDAARSATTAFSLSPASAASRNLRMDVFSADFTDLLR